MRRFVNRIPAARVASSAVSQSSPLGRSCSPRAIHIAVPAGTSDAMAHGRTRGGRGANRCGDCTPDGLWTCDLSARET